MIMTVEKKIEDALEGLRPYLKADGGDISLVEVTADMKALVLVHTADMEALVLVHAADMEALVLVYTADMEALTRKPFYQHTHCRHRRLVAVHNVDIYLDTSTSYMDRKLHIFIYVYKQTIQAQRLMRKQYWSLGG